MSCERCDRRLRIRGAHLCAECATLLGRSQFEPFWGDFASHPDAQLLKRDKPAADLRERGPLIGRMWGLPLYGPVQ